MIKDLVKEFNLEESIEKGYDDIINSYYVDKNDNVLILGAKGVINENTGDFIKNANIIAYAYITDLKEVDIVLNKIKETKSFKSYYFSYIENRILAYPYKDGFVKIEPIFDNINETLISYRKDEYFKRLELINTKSFKSYFLELINKCPDFYDVDNESNFNIERLFRELRKLDYMLLSDDEEIRELYLKFKQKDELFLFI